VDVCIIPDADIRVLFLLFSAQQAQHYSVRRMRSRMMKSCDQRGLGASPTTSKRQGWYHLALLAELFFAKKVGLRYQFNAKSYKSANCILQKE
jgi:hypothetical protein